jgi:hypothetical protein
VGEALALDAAWLFAGFLLILVLAAAGIAIRRFLLERGGATVECALRRGPRRGGRPGRPGAGRRGSPRGAARGPWRLGVASYRRDELCWFGVFGITTRPDEVFPRRDLAVVSRRPPTGPEASVLGPGRIIVACQLGDADAAAAGPGGGTVELALAESALTGLLAWLEAAPPGSHLGAPL